MCFLPMPPILLNILKEFLCHQSQYLRYDTKLFERLFITFLIFKELKSSLKLKEQNIGCLKYIIYTKLGDGPKILTDTANHLLTEAGVPIRG